MDPQESRALLVTGAAEVHADTKDPLVHEEALGLQDRSAMWDVADEADRQAEEGSLECQLNVDSMASLGSKEKLDQLVRLD